MIIIVWEDTMRVIAGSARRTQLKTLEGMNTRPTQDRIKETLFNMLQYDLADCTFLDLFAGSGHVLYNTVFAIISRSLCVSPMISEAIIMS